MNTSRLCRAAALLAAAMLLSACSQIEQKRLEYRDSRSLAPLQIPAGLQAPHSDTMLPLPEVDPAGVGVDVSPPVNLPEELLAAPDAPQQSDSDNADAD